MENHSIYVVCDHCSTLNLILANYWSTDCRLCKEMVVAPRMQGFRYTEANCLGKTVIYNIPKHLSIFACTVCNQSYQIGTVVKRQICGQSIHECHLVSQVIANLESENERLKMLIDEKEEYIEDMEKDMAATRDEETILENNRLLQAKLGFADNVRREYAVAKQKMINDLQMKDAQIQQLQQELQNLRPTPIETSKPVQCDICASQCVVHQIWGAMCSNPLCKNLVLQDISNGHRYVETCCMPMSFIHRFDNNATRFRCACCDLEHIIESTIASTKNGQPIYNTRLAEEVPDVEEEEEEVEADHEDNNSTEVNEPNLPRFANEWLLELTKTVKELKEQNALQQLEISDLRSTYSKTIQLNQGIVNQVTEDAVAKVQPTVEKMFESIKETAGQWERTLKEACQMVEDTDSQLQQEKNKKTSLMHELLRIGSVNEHLQKINVMVMEKIGKMSGKKEEQEEEEGEEKKEEKKKEEVENEDLVDKFMTFLGF